MTSIQYDWWVLTADRDDPEVAKQMSYISPGYTPDRHDLRQRTERALLSTVLVTGSVPPEAKKVKPSHFLEPVHRHVWAAMLQGDGFEAIRIVDRMEAAGVRREEAVDLIDSVLSDFSPVDMTGFYARKVIAGAAFDRAASQ